MQLATPQTIFDMTTMLQCIWKSAEDITVTFAEISIETVTMTSAEIMKVHITYCNIL